MPRVGAHVSAAVSLELSLERASNIGAECTQIFISPPQQWLQTKHSDKEVAEYRRIQQESKIGPNFIHGTYLINLATDNPDHLSRSISWLVYAMDMASKLGITGVIFHPGSHKGRGFEAVKNQIVKALTVILSETKNIYPSASPQDDNTPYLILENCAGSGGVVGNIPEIGELIKKVGNPQLRVCIDTQHSFAQGYDLTKSSGLEKLVFDIKNEVGWENLVAVHCNDSKVELGSNRDRHENIGEGFIGKEGIKAVLNHPNFKDLPFILEVPGFSGNGPDRENVDIIASLMPKIR